MTDRTEEPTPKEYTYRVDRREVEGRYIFTGNPRSARQLLITEAEDYLLLKHNIHIPIMVNIFMREDEFGNITIKFKWVEP